MPAAKIRLTARVYLLLALLQGLLVLGVLLRQRSESEQAVLLGLSATRITLAAALLAIVVSWGLLLLLSFVRPAWFDQASWRLSAWLSLPKVWGWAFVLSLAGFFSGLYLLLLTANPQSFDLPVAAAERTPHLLQVDMLYYSLITQCSVGYGDILPATDVARMLAVIQAVVGQFYMAVVVAVFVGMYATQRRE